MELIKKKILQSLTTGLTTTAEGTFIRITPDLDATYNMKININSDIKDVGIFDTWVEVEGVTVSSRPTAPDPPDDELVIG